MPVLKAELNHSGGGRRIISVNLSLSALQKHTHTHTFQKALKIKRNSNRDHLRHLQPIYCMFYHYTVASDQRAVYTSENRLDICSYEALPSCKSQGIHSCCW